MSTPPRPRAARAARGRPRDAAAAREAILDAAQRRFSERGYVGTRLADVAADAGYSEALVFFHFKSKAELFKAVVSRIDQDARWFDPEEEAGEFVAHMREGELRYHLDPRWRGLDHVWAEAQAGDRELLELIRPQLHRSVEALEALLTRLDRRGHTGLRSQALLLLAVSYGARVLRRYDPEAVSPEEAAELMGLAAAAVMAELGRGGEGGGGGG